MLAVRRRTSRTVYGRSVRASTNEMTTCGRTRQGGGLGADAAVQRGRGAAGGPAGVLGGGGAGRGGRALSSPPARVGARRCPRSCAQRWRPRRPAAPRLRSEFVRPNEAGRRAVSGLARGRGGAARVQQGARQGALQGVQLAGSPTRVCSASGAGRVGCASVTFVMRSPIRMRPQRYAGEDSIKSATTCPGEQRRPRSAAALGARPPRAAGRVP